MTQVIILEDHERGHYVGVITDLCSARFHDKVSFRIGGHPEVGDIVDVREGDIPAPSQGVPCVV